MAIALSAAFFGSASEASAQDQIWLRDRKYTEGPGIRVGDFELHPGLAAEFGYDSNFFRRGDAAVPGPVGALRLRVTPSFSVSTIGPQRQEGKGPTAGPDVEFRGTLNATYNEFFPVNGGDASLQNALQNQRNISGNLDLNLNLFPRKVWSGTIYAGAGRTVAPNEFGAFESSFNRVLVRAGAELAWTPGGGLLDWRLGYRLSGTVFEAQNLQGLTNLEHTIQTRGRWRFLPRTALIYDARFGIVNYTTTNSFKDGSHPLRVQLGVNGLITPSFSVMALGGWGATFYDFNQPNTAQDSGAADFDSFIGQAEVKWFITPNPGSDPGNATLAISSLSIGFIRDFADSYIGTYIERNRGYANFSYFFGGRALMVLDASVGPVVYPTITNLPVPNSILAINGPFTDIRYEIGAFGEYRIKDYFGVNATIKYGGNASQQSITSDGAVDPFQWQTFEAFLGARFLM